MDVQALVVVLEYCLITVDKLMIDENDPNNGFHCFNLIRDCIYFKAIIDSYVVVECGQHK